MIKNKKKKEVSAPSDQQTVKELKLAFREMTKEAEEDRFQRFRNRYKETAPAPSYKIKSTNGDEIQLTMNCEAEAMLEACGSVNMAFANHLIRELSGATCHTRKKTELDVANAGLAALAGIAPTDEAEAMLAAQMVATHQAAMKTLGMAMRDEQLNVATWRGGFAVKLLRTFTMQMEALSRHRCYGQQTVRVEHVTVNAGGQAIVGHVTGGGGTAKNGGTILCKGH